MLQYWKLRRRRIYKQRKYSYIRILSFVCCTLFLGLLFGCSEKTFETNYFSLTGESEHWKVDSYKIEISPETLKAGSGIVTKKAGDSFYSEAYSIRVYAVIDKRHEVIQGTSASGSVPLEMDEITTGTIEGGPLLDKEGQAITIDHIHQIYMMIAWEEASKGDWQEEKIILYDRDEL